MALPINGIAPIVAPVVPTAAPVQAPSNGVFRQMFQSSVGQVQAAQLQAHGSVQSFLSGESEDLHKVALDTQRAELNFDMFLQVRNKVVQAYQEIMRMQV